MNLTFSTYIALLICYLTSDSLNAQTDTLHIKYSHALPIYDQLFQTDTPLVCTLKTDLKKYQKEKFEGKYQKAYFIYNNGEQTVSKKIKIRARGVVRKKLCHTPPFLFKVQKKSKNDSTITIQPKIKLVSHCSYQSEYINYLFKEYLTYKTYSILTPYSFKVRLLNITYLDTGRKNKTYTTWGFLIEPLDVLAERVDCVPIKMNHLGIHYTDSAATDLLSMWAYMVGNTDWSVVGQHNIKLLKSTNFNVPAPIAVPYDFDYCGLVNTDYAMPGDGLGLDDVQERLFIGPCRETIDYNTAAQALLNKKEETIALINSFEYLNKNDKTEMIGYLNNCYNSIKRKDFIKYHIDTDCRTPSSNDE